MTAQSKLMFMQHIFTVYAVNTYCLQCSCLSDEVKPICLHGFILRESQKAQHLLQLRLWCQFRTCGGSQWNTLFCSFSNNLHRARLYFCILLKTAETVEMPPPLLIPIHVDTQKRSVIISGSILWGKIIRKRLWGGNTGSCGSVQQSQGCTLTLAICQKLGEFWLQLFHFYQPFWQVTNSLSVCLFSPYFLLQELIWFQRTSENNEPCWHSGHLTKRLVFMPWEAVLCWFQLLGVKIKLLIKTRQFKST